VCILGTEPKDMPAQIKSDWGASIYPIVPGHEIVGIVTEVGDEVKNFKVGDRAGVGCFIDSCR